ncbi:MAG: hypothetical protein JWP80_4409 [Pseudomonas sp.]|nr:hypothetical protein [Pseudomonas sp.]
MGVSLAGLVFRSKVPLRDMGALVSKLCGGQAVAIEQPQQSTFDIRNPSDVKVVVFGDVYVICNNDVAWDLLENPTLAATQRHCVLGAPELLLAFCHYESGDSYGYAFIERGERIRSRLQTGGPMLIEHGKPKAFEACWLSAPFYLEEDDCPPEEWRKIYFQGNREVQVAEADLTRRMLQEALLLHFGVCPWEDEVTAASYYFRLSVSDKKPWWQLW